MDLIKKELLESIAVKKRVAEEMCPIILKIAQVISQQIRAGNKIVFFGNGGSAADAQHLAGEFVSRFKFERKGLPALALNVNTSVLTAVGNDYGFDQVFSRQVEALVMEGDVVIGITTSGASVNVINGLLAAKEKGAITMGMTGSSGTRLRELVDYLVEVPSFSTPRIQEVHITVGHIICGVVEELVFGDQKPVVGDIRPGRDDK